MEDIQPWVDRLKSNDPSFTTLKTLLDNDENSIPIGDDGAKALAPCIKSNHILKELLIDFADIDTAGILVLLGALHDHPSIETIRLDFNDVGDEGAEALGEILKSEHSKIKELYLCCCHIGAAGLKSLVEACKCNNGTLETLDLFNNRFTGDDICQVFEKFAADDIKLKELVLSGNRMRSRGAIAVANLLRHNKMVEVLLLGSNEIDSSAGNAFGDLLKMNTTLKELDLLSNDLGDGYFACMIEGLRHNSSLERLDVSYTGIGDKTVHALVAVLKYNCALKSLKMLSNTIRDSGAQFLAELLNENQTLESIDASNCAIGDEGLVALARGLRQNTAITDLKILRNKYGLRGVESICDVLKSGNRTLKDFSISLKEAGLEGVAAVVDMLQHNNSLKVLNVADSNITAEGAKVLCVGLRNNHGLKELYLYGEVGNELMSAIVNDVLQNNFVLEKIQLHGRGKYDHKLMEEMKVFLRWNKAGRRMLRERLPEAMWPFVLARSSRDLDVLYCFLQSKPDLMMFFQG